MHCPSRPLPGAPILNEAEKHAPTLVELLRISTGYGKKNQSNHDILIGTCISII